MGLIHYFSPQPELSLRPTRLRNPFQNNPHLLAIQASEMLQEKLNSSPALTQSLWQQAGGKMFGVLVVCDPAGQLGYLAGFSGMLNQRWTIPGFVPPLFDVLQQDSFLRRGESELEQLSRKIQQLIECPDRLQAMEFLSVLKHQREQALKALRLRNKANKKIRHNRRLELQKITNREKQLIELSFQSQADKRQYKQSKKDWDDRVNQAQELVQFKYEHEIHALRQQRKRLSQQLQQQVFDGYQIRNGQGEVMNVRSLFRGRLPPGGTGDCAAPRLLQYAHRHGLTPLALAEFWWGAPPLKEVRHHGHFYAPCRGKCHPVLPFMLQGIKLEQSSQAIEGALLTPSVVYEDQDLVVLNKPAGLLSVPGKEQHYSVQSWLQHRYAGDSFILLVHRLDMATSGLLLAAKSSRVHKKLQRQFINRSIQKRYVAVLSKAIEEREETINLPLRVDLDDRPRQLVCHEFGKQAITRVKVLTSDAHTSRVHFFPQTGRTHQLRVHAAHPAGLSAPIVGDELYGTKSERLLLHAECLDFEHPRSGNIMQIKETAPF